jgi:hypothetical protein
MTEFFKHLFPSCLKKIAPSLLYTYHTPPDGSEQFRLILRIEPNVKGVDYYAFYCT